MQQKQWVKDVVRLSRHKRLSPLAQAVAVVMVPLIIGVALLLTSPWVAAVTTVTVKVTVVMPPPCKINGDQPIEVDFEEVVTTRVEGQNYIRTVPYSLECTGLSSNDMTLMVEGDHAGFGTNVLATDKADLGIALLANDRPLALNTNLKFTNPNKPELKAFLAKRPGSTLKAGKFSAGAILKVAYQ
ncbi:TPA: fimbrial protein [Serratia fonticola]